VPSFYYATREEKALSVRRIAKAVSPTVLTHPVPQSTPPCELSLNLSSPVEAPVVIEKFHLKPAPPFIEGFPQPGIGVFPVKTDGVVVEIR
jgi:hypothetical protein